MEEIKAAHSWASFERTGDRFEVPGEGIWEIVSQSSRWGYTRSGDRESWEFAVLARKCGTAGNAYLEGVFIANDEREGCETSLSVNTTPYAWGRDVSEAWEEVCS